MERGQNPASFAIRISCSKILISIPPNAKEEEKKEMKYHKIKCEKEFNAEAIDQIYKGKDKTAPINYAKIR